MNSEATMTQTFICCRRNALLAFATLALSLPVAAQTRVPVTDMREALREALIAPVSGTFIGPLADYFAREFKTREPVLVDIERIAPHAQAGCGRLRVALRQAAVRVPDAKGQFGGAREQTLVYSVNYCAHGDFPQGEEKIPEVRRGQL
jgi:hypothetical protein